MSATIEVAGLSSYLEVFSEVQQRTARQPAWLRSLRESAFGRFCDAGFPTTKDEDWRFTSVAPISHLQFDVSQSSKHPSASDLERYRVKGAACRLVFVDGGFDAGLSDKGNLLRGVVASSLASEIAENPENVRDHLNRYSEARTDAFGDLNLALFSDGGYIRVAAGTKLEGPIHLLHVATGASGQGADTARMAQVRNLLVVEPRAQVEVVEEYVSLGDGLMLTNGVTELIAGEDTSVSHYFLERENLESFNISTLYVHQDRGSNVKSHSVLIGGALVRNNVHPILEGEGAESLISGLFVGDGTQHLDNYMLVEHVSPHCTSHQYYNGILSGHAHGVFHGRILVLKDAQRTDAKQTNRNLLLSDDAVINTKPQLEIYADDVKCTHGATTGQLDEAGLYYMRSRGLPEAEAREMLLVAFAAECLNRIDQDSIRAYIEPIVHGAMPQKRVSADAGSSNETN